MEMRERNKGFGVPSSIGSFHPVPQERANSQALNHLLLHQNLDLQLQEAERVGGGRDQNPDPDPAQLVTSATINPASDSQTPPQQPPHPPTATAAASTTVRYRECLKNHAASMGSHVVDGCGEFMPSGEDGTAEALKCAACDCHRNFHRREIEGEGQPPKNSPYPQNPTRNNTRRNPFSSLQSSQPPPAGETATQQQPKYHQGFAAFANSPSTGLMPPIMMAFGGTSGAPAESSSEDLNVFHNNAGGQQSKKRFRTKFSQEQKDRMTGFAERIGWKIQKQDEQEVQQFCNANGVKRQVFKVWMHNNKQAMKKKQL